MRGVVAGLELDCGDGCTGFTLKWFMLRDVNFTSILNGRITPSQTALEDEPGSQQERQTGSLVVSLVRQCPTWLQKLPSLRATPRFTPLGSLGPGQQD